ncbi:hypothetical protein GL273_03160 [Aeromonas jandaei]|nr:hypothetical protein [Aeromonas jandaei]
MTSDRLCWRYYGDGSLAFKGKKANPGHANRTIGTFLAASLAIQLSF